MRIHVKLDTFPTSEGISALKATYTMTDGDTVYGEGTIWLRDSYFEDNTERVTVPDPYAAIKEHLTKYADATHDWSLQNHPNSFTFIA